MELLDAFDDNLNRIGEETIEETHKNALWHQVFHDWVIRPHNKILVQKRSSDVSNNAGLLCVSVGGHMQAGETIRDCPREIKEELGLTIMFSSVTYIGNIHLHAPREIAHVFFMQDNTPLEEYKLQKEEVDGIYEMGINEGLAFFSGKTQTITLNGYKRTENGLVSETINAKHEDFTSASKKPWLWLFSKAKRYLNGHYDDQITEVDIKNPLEIF